MFGQELIGHNDPDQYEKIIKFNELLANAIIYSNACDITAAANTLAAEGHQVDPEDLATISPYLTHNVRRFSEYVLRSRSSRAPARHAARPHPRHTLPARNITRER